MLLLLRNTAKHRSCTNTRYSKDNRGFSKLYKLTVLRISH